ncbi:MAG: Small ribosomal subunit biogenesis GTPase RsgA [Flavobacteriaceae bacterium]|nr:MAG: Small ribosomal subunit biogenesis GTPase RsgA [Flavobacteriaceae bacterium]
MKGLVYKSTGSWYQVKSDEGNFYQCRIKGKLRLSGIRSTSPVAVGDRVGFDLDDEAIGVIHTIDQRENYLVRKSVNLSKQLHIIGANIDLIFLVITLKNPETFTTFIDRFLVSAAAFGIETVLLFNKMDQYTEEELEMVNELKELYASIGYQSVFCSTKSGQGMSELRNLMKDNTSIFSGHSGVGKSTLINTVAPELRLKIGEISEQHGQGQHTTTFAEMFDLSFGGRIIDSPGIRGFGIADIDKEEIARYFKEFFKASENCKFNNCQHLSEPGCAVKSELEEGAIAESRYQSYLSMVLEEEGPYRQDLFAE